MLYSSWRDCSLAEHSGFNGLHAFVCCKSPDSTQVCSPVSSKGCEEWSRCDEKEDEIYLFPSSSSCKMSSKAQREKSGRDTPINTVMPLDVCEMPTSLQDKDSVLASFFLSATFAMKSTQRGRELGYTWCLHENGSWDTAQWKESRQDGKMWLKLQ